MIIIGMLCLGLLLGLVGAGGAGLMITLLSVAYNVPIHTALGVALASMAFGMLSGTISHFREGNVNLRIGLLVGSAGIVGAFLGSKVASSLPTRELTNVTASLMALSTVILYFQLFHKEKVQRFVKAHAAAMNGSRFYMVGAIMGIFTGFLSGAFGIGATAFIQIGLMLFFGVELYIAVGTTMMIILPISISGGIGYLLSGHLDLNVFAQSLAGITAGTYLGAKFTRLFPPRLLRYIMVCMPISGGILLLLKNH